MADLTGQYTTADLPQMGEFSSTDVDTSTIPSVPLSAMTGVPKTLRDIASHVPNSLDFGPLAGEVHAPTKADMVVGALGAAIPMASRLKAIYGGSWIDAEGGIRDVGDFRGPDTHTSYLHENTNFKGQDEALQNGWIRQRGKDIEVLDPNNPNLIKAMYQAKEASPDGAVNVLSPYAGMSGEKGGRWKVLTVPPEDFGEFINSPTKYYRKTVLGQ